MFITLPIECKIKEKTFSFWLKFDSLQFYKGQKLMRLDVISVFKTVTDVTCPIPYPISFHVRLKISFV